MCTRCARKRDNRSAPLAGLKVVPGLPPRTNMFAARFCFFQFVEWKDKIDVIHSTVERLLTTTTFIYSKPVNT